MLDLALCKCEIFLPSPMSIHEFVVSTRITIILQV
jgi:hypothetical protein